MVMRILNLTAEQIVRAAVDAAGQAGGIDEVMAIAARGVGAMIFSALDTAVLVEAYGSAAVAMRKIQLEAQQRVVDTVYCSE